MVALADECERVPLLMIAESGVELIAPLRIIVPAAAFTSLVETKLSGPSWSKVFLYSGLACAHTILWGVACCCVYLSCKTYPFWKVQFLNIVTLLEDVTVTMNPEEMSVLLMVPPLKLIF